MTTTSFGCLTAENELSRYRTIPSPFQMLKQQDDTIDERSVQQHALAMRKRAARPALELDLTHGLLLGKLHVRANELASDARDALSGWSSSQIERVVPFGRVLRVLDRCARLAPALSRCLPPRGLVNTANSCFANSILQVLFHCEPLRGWLEQLKVRRCACATRRRSPIAASTRRGAFASRAHSLIARALSLAASVTRTRRPCALHLLATPPRRL